jgi:hypothetical protein
VCTVFPASHLKVHATIEKGLADELSAFADFFCSCGAYHILLLVASFFSRWSERQRCRGAKISTEKHKRAEKYFEGPVK